MVDHHAQRWIAFAQADQVRQMHRAYERVEGEIGVNDRPKGAVEVGTQLRRQSVRRLVNAVTGAVLTVLGLRLALERR